METQRTITICLPEDADLKATLEAFVGVQQQVSPVAFNGGDLLSAVEVQRRVYSQLKGTLNSQMTITALRLVVGAYISARSNYKRRVRLEKARKKKFEKRGWNYRARQIKEVGLCQFQKATAMFLVGSRGRDASFKKDGTLSIWTLAGRKHISYTVPAAFKATFESAKEVDSITVIERDGKLYGRVALTLDVPEPVREGAPVVGIDLNETNAVVAIDGDGREFFVTGRETKVLNKRTAQTVGHLQKKLATHKAQKHDTRSVRRVLKRLSRKRRNRTRDFARVVAKSLIAWAPMGSVLVLEDLQMQQPTKELTRGKRLRQRLALWQFGAIREAITNKTQLLGMGVALIDPAYTSQDCSACGKRGKRKNHSFKCKACGHSEHADVNAARNIRAKFVCRKIDGAPSIAPEALSS